MWFWEKWWVNRSNTKTHGNIQMCGDTHRHEVEDHQLFSTMRLSVSTRRTGSNTTEAEVPEFKTTQTLSLRPASDYEHEVTLQ